MPASTRMPLELIVIEHAGGARGNLGEQKTATQANSVILELARALARMAAREDDAAENGGSP